MRTLFADFATLSERPELDLGVCIPLGREDAHPELAGLQDGAVILLVGWGEQHAPGTAKLLEQDGARYWYGLMRREDIQPVAAAGNSSYLTPEDEAIFEEEFEDSLPGLRYLQDK